MSRTGEKCAKNSSGMRKRLPKMSPRLKKIYNLAEGEPAIWDVGTDHGYLPVSLILGGGVGYAVASDINRGPIESASATAQRFGVEDKMELRLCDGLSGEIPDRLSTVIIAGMGGETIINICENAPWIIERNIRLLLQPMTSIAKLREFIYSGKYRVLGEHLIQEKDKIYVIMDIVGGGSTEHFTYLDTRIGKYTIKEEPYRDYLSREIIRLKKESRGADEAEKRAIESAVEDIKEIIKKEVCIDGNNQSGL